MTNKKPMPTSHKKMTPSEHKKAMPKEKGKDYGHNTKHKGK